MNLTGADKSNETGCWQAAAQWCAQLSGSLFGIALEGRRVRNTHCSILNLAVLGLLRIRLVGPFTYWRACG